MRCVVVSVALMLTGCAGAAVVPGAGTGSTPATTAAPVLPAPIPPLNAEVGPGELSGEVVSALLAFRDLGPVAFKENYAGVSSGTPASADVLVIYLAHSTDSVEEQIRHEVGLPREKVAFVEAYQSLAEAKVVEEALWADLAALQQSGIKFVTFGVEEDGVVGIGLAGASDEQVARLFEAYGPYLRIDREAEEPTLL
jgi:hypothetical protein